MTSRQKASSTERWHAAALSRAGRADDDVEATPEPTPERIGALAFRRIRSKASAVAQPLRPAQTSQRLNGVVLHAVELGQWEVELHGVALENSSTRSTASSVRIGAFRISRPARDGSTM
jgi:hypothetical protein